ncbi:MAG TPA: translation elongation factor Ts [Candidatus Dojkabacteria bacterium]|nr:translation elongation factor Ts [Candidatus Dojkabacteria bacterium]
MGVSLEDIKALRDKTSAGISLCKEALEQSGGDFNKAVEYVNARSDVISRLRNLTGAKIGLCKIAYDDAGKDFEKAVEIIKERGWDSPVEEDEKVEGVIECYVHGKDGRLVSLAEVDCKTDFVSKNDGFRAFAHEIALQVAAMKPEFVKRDDIPNEKIEELKGIFQREAEEENKPKEMIAKIVEGKLNKYYSEKCLLDQKWFKDESKTIQSLLDENIQKFGEPIKISRILVWELGK